MARITVEDCLEHVDNRFQLVLVAAKRAHELARGEDPMVDPDHDKPTVIALREIAEGFVTPAILDKKEDVFDTELTDADMALNREIAEVMSAPPADEGVLVESAGSEDEQDLESVIGSDETPEE